MAGESLLVDLGWCENVWCGLGYAADEGWAGLCPSCLALLDEHLAGVHEAVLDDCPDCRRHASSAVPQESARTRTTRAS